MHELQARGKVRAGGREVTDTRVETQRGVAAGRGRGRPVTRTRRASGGGKDGAISKGNPEGDWRKKGLAEAEVSREPRNGDPTS